MKLLIPLLLLIIAGCKEKEEPCGRIRINEIVNRSSVTIERSPPEYEYYMYYFANDTLICKINLDSLLAEMHSNDKKTFGLKYEKIAMK